MPVQDTSRASYDELRPTLTERQNRVLAALTLYERHHGEWPTAYELFEDMKRLNLAKDLNDVRPRLTELREKLRRVYNPTVKRHCRVSRKRAFTWAVVPSDGRLF